MFHEFIFMELISDTDEIVLKEINSNFMKKSNYVECVFLHFGTYYSELSRYYCHFVYYIIIQYLNKH